MGKKSGAVGKQFAVVPRGGVTRARLATFLAVGFVIGLGLGYVFMGTMHAFIEIGTKSHHGQDPVAAAAAEAAKAAQEAAERAAAAEKKAADAAARAAAAEQQLQEVEEKVLKTGAGSGKEAAGSGGGGDGGSFSWPTTGDTIHVAYTSNGSPYTNYQNLIMWGSYQLVQKMPGGEKFVAFTRILHRSSDDGISAIVPTFRADPLHPECDGWCDYPVADRPNAIRQFLDAAKADPSLIKAPWLYMIETDFVFIKPLQAPLAESNAKGIGFPYGYIQPTYPTIEGVMRKFYPPEVGPLTDIPPTGPSPTLMRINDWMKVVPRYEQLTAQIETDKEAKEKLEWVREMYAFSIAAALEKVQLDLKEPPESRTMIQPPADHSLGKAHLMHYTWGPIFKLKNGTELWHFDKRDYTELRHEKELPKLKLPPPFEEGWVLQDGIAVTRALYDTTVQMLTIMNKGIDLVKADIASKAGRRKDRRRLA